LAELQLWRDRNGNGRSDAGELHSWPIIDQVSQPSPLAVAFDSEAWFQRFAGDFHIHRIDGSIGTLEMWRSLSSFIESSAKRRSKEPDSATPTDLARGSALEKLIIGSERLHDAEPTKEVRGSEIGATELLICRIQRG
jgi:hypothetical protein